VAKSLSTSFIANNKYGRYGMLYRSIPLERRWKRWKIEKNEGGVPGTKELPVYGQQAGYNKYEVTVNRAIRYRARQKKAAANRGEQKRRCVYRCSAVTLDKFTELNALELYTMCKQYRLVYKMRVMLTHDLARWDWTARTHPNIASTGTQLNPRRLFILQNRTKLAPKPKKKRKPPLFNALSKPNFFDDYVDDWSVKLKDR
jgi:hypothetical protein